MKTPTAPIWKPTALLLLAATLITAPALHAQTILTLPTSGTAGSGSTAVDFEFRLDGSIYESGAGTSSLSNADLQSASRFLWYPAQSALRAGTGLSTETVAEVGQYSFAAGYQSIASGQASVSIGSFSTANALDAVALGRGNLAGYCSTAIGQANTATATWSAALGGYGNTATGAFSTAIGGACTASGEGAVAIGYQTISTGQNAAAFNYDTTAQAYDVTALGQFNVGGGTATSWVATDPLLELGNGTSATATSDALIVYKNGNVTAQGVITAAPGGDIPMFTGY